MYPGIIILIFLSIIIFMGLAQRVLDRLYLTDNQALIVIVLLIAGSFFNIPLSNDPLITVNVGGALIPFLLAIYVFSKADSTKERLRTVLAVVITGFVIYLVSTILKSYGEGRDLIDPLYIYAITGGISAYIVGRSRRSAFVAGILGYIFYDLINLGRLLSGKILTQLRFGAAGAFDTIVISGLFAVLLAEIIGETRERILLGKEDDSDEK